MENTREEEEIIDNEEDYRETIMVPLPLPGIWEDSEDGKLWIPISWITDEWGNQGDWFEETDLPQDCKQRNGK